MNSERQYASALELTRQMLSAARAQDWDALTRIERQRAQLVEEAAGAAANAASAANLSAAEKGRIAAIIGDIEADNAEILERVQSWREDAKILLRVKD